MITADQLLCHLIGDYLLQSDWVALRKRTSSLAALSHAAWYTTPFGFLQPSILAVLVILASHFAIDRWGLARHVVWFKNWWLGETPPWHECQATGYPPDRPAWMTTWLLIIADNTLHIILNGAALKWL